MCMTLHTDAGPATLLTNASHCSHSGLLAHHAIRQILFIRYVLSFQPQLHIKLLPRQTLTGDSQSLDELVGSVQVRSWGLGRGAGC